MLEQTSGNEPKVYANTTGTERIRGGAMIRNLCFIKHVLKLEMFIT